MSTNEPLRFARVEVGVQGCKFCDQHGKSLTDEWLAKHAVTYITFTGPGKEPTTLIESAAQRIVRMEKNKATWQSVINATHRLMIPNGTKETHHSVFVTGIPWVGGEIEVHRMTLSHNGLVGTFNLFFISRSTTTFVFYSPF